MLRSLVRILGGRQPVTSVRSEGGKLGLPADFLIDCDGGILACRYGDHVYDQWSVSDLLTMAKKILKTRRAACSTADGIACPLYLPKALRLSRDLSSIHPRAVQAGQALARSPLPAVFFPDEPEREHERPSAWAKIAQAHGYGGLNFRDLAAGVGIKAASIYHHFTSKGDLGAAVARRYWEDSAAGLDTMLTESPDPLDCLRWYPETFRKALTDNNRICLCSFMAAEIDDLPDVMRKEVQTFADVNIAWLTRVLVAAKVVGSRQREQLARAIVAAIAGAQLIARSRSDVSLYDALIDGYRAAGLLPA